jgi:hypothetical protein
VTHQSFFDKNSATLHLKSLSGSKSCSYGRRKYLTAHTALTAHHFPHLAAVKQHRFNSARQATQVAVPYHAYHA